MNEWSRKRKTVQGGYEGGDKWAKPTVVDHRGFTKEHATDPPGVEVRQLEVSPHCNGTDTPTGGGRGTRRRIRGAQVQEAPPGEVSARMKMS